jgi:hypothetical protein
MSRPSSPPDKSVVIRCPRLGHEIYFEYCRRENMGLPCFKILDCWFAYFKVEEYLRQSLTAQEWKDVFENPGTPKILSLLENIRKAQKAPKK